MAHKKTGGGKRSRSKGAKKSRSSASPVSLSSAAEMRRMQAEGDLHTLRRAEEVKSDKGRLSAARGMAKKEMAALKKV